MPLQYALFRKVIIPSPFLIFSNEVLMDEMFSFLSDCMPVGDQRFVEKHASVEN
jgi:hypothetical protein